MCQKQVSRACISNCIPQYSVGCDNLSMLSIPASQLVSRARMTQAIHALLGFGISPFYLHSSGLLHCNWCIQSPRCQWSHPEEYRRVSQINQQNCGTKLTTTSKAYWQLLGQPKVKLKILSLVALEVVKMLDLKTFLFQWVLYAYNTHWNRNVFKSSICQFHNGSWLYFVR